MLSTLAGLSIIVVIVRKAKELHRFHSSVLSSLLTTLGGQSYKWSPWYRWNMSCCSAQRSKLCVWMWQREESYEVSWVSVVREVWMARVSFPLHSVQIKMVVVIEVICSRMKKKKGSALPYPAFSLNKLCFCPVVLAVLNDSCNSLNYFCNCLYARFCSQLQEYDIRNYSSHVNGVLLIFFFLMWCNWEHFLVPSVLTPVSKNREGPHSAAWRQSGLSFLQMLLSFCLLGVRRHDGAQECIISFLFLSLLVWGIKKWEGIRDWLAKWIGEGLRNSCFLEHGIWLLGGGCRQGCKWCICRENAYSYFVFPKLQYWRPLVCKSCFQVLDCLQSSGSAPLSHPLAAGWLRS